jgi:hypothetical protein
MLLHILARGRRFYDTTSACTNTALALALLDAAICSSRNVEQVTKSEIRIGETEEGDKGKEEINP